MRITITLDREEDFHLIKATLKVMEWMPSDRSAFRLREDDDVLVFVDRTKAGWSVRLRYQPIETMRNKQEPYSSYDLGAIK